MVMKAVERQRSLKNVPLFYSLTDEELNIISSNIKIKRFSKKQIILPEEDSNDFMYIIIFGKVKVYQTSVDGKEIIVAMHKSGDYFGVMSNLAFSFSIAARKGLRYLTVLPIAFATLHFSYGIGYLRGIWSFIILKKNKRKRIVDIPLTR